METSEHEDGRRRRRSYDEAFKRDAVRLVAEEKYSFKAAATAVNVSEQSLRAWHAKWKNCVPKSLGFASNSNGRSWNVKS